MIAAFTASASRSCASACFSADELVAPGRFVAAQAQLVPEPEVFAGRRAEAVLAHQAALRRQVVQHPIVVGPIVRMDVAPAELRVPGEGRGCVPCDGFDVGTDEADLAAAVQLGDVEDRR
jgi:hypothetical protein